MTNPVVRPIAPKSWRYIGSLERIGLLFVACLYGVLAAFIVTLINIVQGSIACLMEFFRPLYQIPTATDHWILAHNDAVRRRDEAAYDKALVERMDANEYN